VPIRLRVSSRQPPSARSAPHVVGPTRRGAPARASARSGPAPRGGFEFTRRRARTPARTRLPRRRARCGPSTRGGRTTPPGHVLQRQQIELLVRVGLVGAHASSTRHPLRHTIRARPETRGANVLCAVAPSCPTSSRPQLAPARRPASARPRAPVPGVERGGSPGESAPQFAPVGSRTPVTTTGSEGGGVFGSGVGLLRAGKRRQQSQQQRARRNAEVGTRTAEQKDSAPMPRLTFRLPRSAFPFPS